MNHEDTHEGTRPSHWLKPTSIAKRRSRTLYACEPCKRRKIKCSGRPGPCVACRKAEHTCCFDHKNEPGVKTCSSSATYSGELYVLIGVLQALKYGSDAPLMHLVHTLRQSRPCTEIVDSLRLNLELLQERGIIPKAKLEDADLVSLAEKSNANRLAWVERFPRQHLDPVQGECRDDLPLNVSNLLSSLSSSNISPVFSPPIHSPGRSPIPSSAALNHSVNTPYLAISSNFDRTQHSHAPNSIPYTIHVGSHPILRPSGSTNLDQHILPTYGHYQHSEQQWSHPVVYTARQPANLTVTTAPEQWLFPLPAGYHNHVGQSYYHPTQYLPPPPHEEIPYPHQRAY